MPVGGNTRYPSLEMIAQLFRAQINDSFAGATNTPGEGLVMPDTNPDLLVFMNSAIRDVYSDLRNVGDPALILDNYVLYGIPPLTAPNPAIQVSLDVVGFFDGFQFNDQWALPAGCMRVERMWERVSGTEDDFSLMTPAPFGLPPVMQSDLMGQWETRLNAVWMPGALLSVDLRLRTLVTFPDFLGDAIDFPSTYVPILDCTNSVVAKMIVLYAKRYAPEQYTMAVQEDERMIGKLRREVVRNMQNTEYSRAPFGQEATSSFGWLTAL
jgi:hypothetical protein